MSSLTVALFGATCFSLAFSYFLGKFRGSRRDADDYIQKSALGSKQTDGLKTFLEYVAEHSSPEPHPEPYSWKEIYRFCIVLLCI